MYFEVVDRLGGKHYGSPAFSVADSCAGGVRGLVFMSDDKPPPSLEELDSRLKKIQEERQRPEGLGMPPTRTGQSLHLGIEMAATLAVGGGIGWFLDRWSRLLVWRLSSRSNACRWWRVWRERISSASIAKIAGIGRCFAQIGNWRQR